MATLWLGNRLLCNLPFLLCFALNKFFLPPYAGYILFIPAAVLTTLFAGYAAGIGTVLLSLFAVWYFFGPLRILVAKTGASVALSQGDQGFFDVFRGLEM